MPPAGRRAPSKIACPNNSRASSRAASVWGSSMPSSSNVVPVSRWMSKKTVGIAGDKAAASHEVPTFPDLVGPDRKQFRLMIEVAISPVGRADKTSIFDQLRQVEREV